MEVVSIDVFNQLKTLSDVGSSSDSIIDPFCKYLSMIKEKLSGPIVDILTQYGYNREDSSFTRDDFDVNGLLEFLLLYNTYSLERFNRLQESLIGGFNSSEFLMRYLIKLIKNGEMIKNETLSFYSCCLTIDLHKFNEKMKFHNNNGKKGVSILNKISKNYFNDIFLIIYSFGGDILQFDEKEIKILFTPINDDNNFDENFEINEKYEWMFFRSLRCAEKLSNLVLLDEKILKSTVDFGIYQVSILGGNDDNWEFTLLPKYSLATGIENPTPMIDLNLTGFLVFVSADCLLFFKDSIETKYSEQCKLKKLENGYVQLEKLSLDFVYQERMCLMDRKNLLVIDENLKSSLILKTLMDQFLPLSLSGKALKTRTSAIISTKDSAQFIASKQVYNNDKKSPKNEKIEKINDTEIRGPEHVSQEKVNLSLENPIPSHGSEQYGESKDSIEKTEKENIINSSNLVVHQEMSLRVVSYLNVRLELPIPSGNPYKNNPKDFLNLQPTFSFIQKVSLEAQAHLGSLHLELNNCLLQDTKNGLLLGTRDGVSIVGGNTKSYLDRASLRVEVSLLWGLPELPATEKPLRALVSAVRLRDHFSKLGCKISFGLATGQLSVGVLMSPVRVSRLNVGDSIDLAQRLAKRASTGCIYLCTETFSRLPYQSLTAMQKLPKEVSGESSVIFSYSSDVVLNVADSNYYEVRDDAKITILEHIDGLMAENKPISTGDTHGSFSQAAMQQINNLPPNFFEKKTQRSPFASPLKFLLIEGRYGSGKASTVDWCRRQAGLRDITVLNLRIDSRDGLVEHRVISRLFRLLIRPEIFDNIDRQKIFISYLLKEVYKDNIEFAEKVAFPVLKTALGVTAPVIPTTENNPAQNNPLQSWQILDIVKDVFNYLLSSKPFLIVLNHVHFADERSLKCLLHLQQINSRSLLVLTAVTPAEGIELQSFSRSDYLMKVSPEALKKDPLVKHLSERAYLTWLGEFRKLFLQCDYLTVVDISDLSVEEVAARVETYIEPALPADKILSTSQLIMDISDGEPFWVFESIETIKSIGFDGFISNLLPILNRNQMQSLGTNPLDLERKLTATTAKSTYLESAYGITAPCDYQAVDYSPERWPVSSSSRSIVGGTAVGNVVTSVAEKVVSDVISQGALDRLRLPDVQSSEEVVGVEEEDSFEKEVLEVVSEFEPTGKTTENEVKSSEEEPDILKKTKEVQGLLAVCTSEERVRALVRCRFGLLEQAAQKVLLACSVVGFYVSQVEVTYLLGKGSSTEVGQALHELLNNHWLIRTRAKGKDFEFCHPWSYTALYSIQPKGKLVELHQRMADYVEQNKSQSLKDFSGLCAYYSHCHLALTFQYCIMTSLLLLQSPLLDLELSLQYLNKSLSFSTAIRDVEVAKEVLTMIQSCLKSMLKRHFTRPEVIYTLENSAVGSKSTSFVQRMVSKAGSFIFRASTDENEKAKHESKAENKKSVRSVQFSLRSPSVDRYEHQKSDATKGSFRMSFSAVAPSVYFSRKSGKEKGEGAVLNSPTEMAKAAAHVIGTGDLISIIYNPKIVQFLQEAVDLLEKKMVRMKENYTIRGFNEKPLEWQQGVLQAIRGRNSITRSNATQDYLSINLIPPVDSSQENSTSANLLRNASVRKIPSKTKISAVDDRKDSFTATSQAAAHAVSAAVAAGVHMGKNGPTGTATNVQNGTNVQGRAAGEGHKRAKSSSAVGLARLFSYSKVQPDP